MRGGFSLIGLLLVVAIVGWQAKSMFAPAVSHDPNDRSTIEYWVSHNSDRATMLAWCQRNPQQQDSASCQLATAAQMKLDAEVQSGEPAQSGGQGGGVDQASQGTSDQLNASQDANAVDPGGQ